MHDSNGLTKTGEIVGTTYYMAPEQFLNNLSDARVDIYSFGIVAYELFTGKRPFESENYLTLYAQHLTEPMPSIKDSVKGAPRWLQTFIDRCTAKDPAARFQSIEEAALPLVRKLEDLNLPIPQSFGDYANLSTVVQTESGRRAGIA